VVDSYQSNVARDVLDTILNIQPKDSSSGGETRETIVYRIAEDFLSKLPKNYVDYEVICGTLCQQLYLPARKYTTNTWSYLLRSLARVKVKVNL